MAQRPDVGRGQGHGSINTVEVKFSGYFMEKEFKKKYPSLARELDGDDRVKIGGVRSSADEAEKAVQDKYAGYEPAAIDFLRRCESDEEGLEIIDYLLQKGEIEKEYADKLKMQLLDKGIRSFGPQKEKGHYMEGI